jgi:hypothetical protein
MGYDPANEIRQNLQEIARSIKKQIPNGFSFVLLVAEHGEGGTTLYVADMQRADALQVMREFVAHNMEERNWRREMPELELNEEFEAWWLKQQTRQKVDLKQQCRDAFVAGRATA